MISCVEAAGSAGVTTGTMSRWLLEGVVEGEKRGGRWFVEPGSLTKALHSKEHALASRTAGSSPAPREPVWTVEDDAELLGLRGDGRSWADIGRAMHRSGAACAGRWRRLSLGGPVKVAGFGGEWTPEEDEYIKAHYLATSCREIADTMGRTEAACYARAKRLGLHRPVRGGARANTGNRRGDERVTHRCCMCGRPTPDRRCPACRAKWLKANGVETGAIEYDDE